MKLNNSMKTIPALAALVTLAATCAYAGHSVGSGNIGNVINNTFIAPYYAQPGDSGPTDAIAAFSTLVTPTVRTTILNLAVPLNSKAFAAFGSVSNNGGPPLSFSSLSFDASSVNPLTQVEIYAAQPNGLTEAGYALFSQVTTPPTRTTPPGYTHCVVNLSNLLGPNNQSQPIPAQNVLEYSAIIQFGDNVQTRATNIANANLNNSRTNALPVMRAAQNVTFLSKI